MIGKMARVTRPAVLLMAISVATPVHAASAASLRTRVASPHLLSDAVARQRAPLAAARRTGRRGNTAATKVSAGVAMGLAGFGVGMTGAWGVCNAVKCAGSNHAEIMAGGIIGAAAGAALGVWLASR